MILALPVRMAARDQVTASKVACRLLLKAAVLNHLAIEKNPGEYFCGVATEMGEYFVIDLHRTDELVPKDWVGSSLVGYYGVDKKDGVIVEWDVIGEAPGNPINTRSPGHLNKTSPTAPEILPSVSTL